jgi:hypothetical protein
MTPTEEALNAFKTHCRTDISRAAFDALKRLEVAISDLQKERDLWELAARAEAEIGKSAVFPVKG